MRKKLLTNSPYLAESKKKKNNLLKKRILTYVLVFLAVFISLVLLSRWSKLNIKQVVVAGNTVTDTRTIETTIMNKITDNYLFVFPKANFLIYPRNNIKETLADEFKILKDISVNLKGVSTLEITFSERVGKYMWCGNILPEQDTVSKCYFMDNVGYIFGEAPYFSGDVYLKFFGEADKFSDIPLGSHFSPELFSKLLAFREAVSNMDLKTSAILVKKDGDVELLLTSNASYQTKPRIIFKSSSNIEKIAENLQTALATEPLATDVIKKYENLEYIDLRFGNKVYYKFK